MFPKKINPSFLSLIIAALIVRLMSQAGKPFWLDEAISWSFAKQNISQILLATAADNHPPLYYLFLHFWLKINQSEFFLRLPSIIFGLTSVWLVYLIGKKMFGKSIGRFSAILMAFSPLNVYFSAETRMYSLWTLEILAIFYFFLKIMEKPKKIHYLIFAILSLLALYTHYFTLLFIFALDLLLIYKLPRPERPGLSLKVYRVLRKTWPLTLFSQSLPGKFLILPAFISGLRSQSFRQDDYKRRVYRKQLINLSIIQASLGLLFLPWALVFFTNAHPQPWEIPLIIAIPATYLSFVLGGLGATTLKTFFAPSTPSVIKGFFLLVSLYFLVFAILGILKKMRDEIRLTLLFFLFFPVLLTIFISLFKPLYSPRSFIVFSPLFYLLVSLGLEKIRNPLRGWLKLTAVTLLGATLLIQNFYPSFKPQTLKEAADFLKENSSPSSVIVHTDILTFYPFQYYFRDGGTSQLLIFPSGLTPKTTDIVGGSPVSFQKITEGGQPFWSVAYAWDEKTWRFKAEQLKLKDEFNYSSAKTINNLEIFYHYPSQSTSSPLPR